MREPLLHFLLAGLVLFVAYRELSPRSAEPSDVHRVELTADDLRQIQVAWLAQGRGPLTPEQMQNLVEARVREEILYREALALGLDKDDAIVRRRMAQKMEFLFEDVAALRDPTDRELRDWFERHAERFALPARASFRHLYFSPDHRGARAHADAERALDELSGRLRDDPAAPALADSFMLQDDYGDRSLDDVARTFGPGFARALFQLPTGTWAGPIESGYGWHVVWLDAFTPARVPTFEEVTGDIRREWIEDQRGEMRERAFEAMRARYEVVMPKNPGAADLASVPTADPAPAETAR